MKNLDHVALIMDGNGRWAKLQNKPRIFGHLNGVEIIKEIIDSCIELKIKYVSFFAFSIENWNRPIKEVNFLLGLFYEKINQKTIDYFSSKNIKFNWIGFEEKMPKNLLKKIKHLENLTKNNSSIECNIFFNYSGTQDLQNAFMNSIKDNFSKNNIKNYLLTKKNPSVDLLIRTGGEKRISNFMLYDIAYTEIIFEKTLWPAYNKNIFFDNIKEYNNRKRKFGIIDE